MVSSINFLPEKADKPLPRISLVLPFLGAFLVITSLSLAYFFDIENSIGNIFGAGTWGPPPPQIAQTLVINEVLPDSSCFVGQSQKEGQWLEVYNGYNTNVELKDFKITDGLNNTIALLHSGSLILAPGEFALLAHDQSIWVQCEPDRNTNVQTGQLGTGNFDIDKEFLQLKDASDNPIDTVKWGTAEGIDPPQDQSIEREPDGLDTAPVGTAFNASDFQVKNLPQPGF